MIDTASDSRPFTPAFHLLVPLFFFPVVCWTKTRWRTRENQGWGQIALGGCNTSRGATHVPPALLERPYLASVGACSRARVARRAACTFLLRAPHGRRVRRFCRAQQQVAAATAPRAPLRGEACATTSGGVCFSSWGRVARPCIVGPERRAVQRRPTCSLPRGSRVPAAPLEHASMAGAGASRAARRGTPRSRRSDKASDTPAEVIDLTSPDEGRGSAAQAGAAGAGTRSAPQGGAAAGGRTRSERAKRPIVVDLCGDSPSPPPSKRARRTAAAAATAGQVRRRP